MDLARVLHEQVLAAATAPRKASAGGETQPKGQPDPAASFAKLSRAIRLTVDLKGRVDEAPRETRLAALRQRALNADGERAQAARNRVERQVGIAIAGRTHGTRRPAGPAGRCSTQSAARLSWSAAGNDGRASMSLALTPRPD